VAKTHTFCSGWEFARGWNGVGSRTTFLTALQTMENGCAWVADYSKEAAVPVA
jgi:hypothetical protein